MATKQESLGGGQPLDGVILCCTAISPDKRSELANVASQMGAVHKLDLTSDVTHLIVGDTETPKYKFVAKERPDVKCLLPTWVEALRELWMEGGEPDVQALELRHTLPALHQLRVCVTGFEDMAYRKKLEDLVSINGGEYRANLTKDVTHLIAKEASGAKYKYAIDWNIKIVAVEWLAQCLERGMILDEKLYNLSTPPAERGHDAWIRQMTSASSLGKRILDGDALLSGPRKLRRVASTKLSSQNVGLWTDIVSGGFQAERPKRDQWSEQPVLRESNMQGTSSTNVRSEGTSSDGPSRSSATTVKTPVPPQVAHPLPRTGIFAGKRLYLHGFNQKKTAVLHKHLLSHEAVIISDLLSFTPSATSPESDFILVPHDMPRDQIPTLPENLNTPITVTDMWIERNLHQKQFVRPEANVTNSPFQRFPIPGFERLTVCSTTFEGVDLLHMSRAVKLMGATYDEDLTPKASVLVCRQVIPDNEKLRHAHHWNIPTVTAEWLWDSVRSGELRPFDPYFAQLYSKRSTSGALKQELVQDVDEIKRNTNVGKNTSPGQETRKPASASRVIIPAKSEKNSPSPPPPSETTKFTLPQPPAPLQEISPNSSPAKSSTSPFKAVPLSKPLSSDLSLSSAISSLLAHHQTARSSIPAAPPNPPPRHVRRKRQLLGRAPSNASNLSMSRASSVDTVNTDGVGTPVEPAAHSSYAKTNISLRTTNTNTTPHDDNNSTITTTTNTTSIDESHSNLHPLLLSHYPSDDDNERQRLETQILNDEQLQMTQLGYEDPDALAWRATVARKLGGGGDGPGEGEGEGDAGGGRRKIKEIGVVKDVMGSMVPVGRRTRGAAAAAGGAGGR
ncbi:protein kinase activating protein dpb11 [Xanthoria parietina]